MGVPTDQTNTERRLRRQLGWLDATALFVGTIIGSGIFVAPAAVAGAAPGLGTALGLWLLGAVITGCGAFCYAECGARLPWTGGFFVTYRQAFGEGAAFIGGWAALLITYPASMAAIALIGVSYLGELWPGAQGREVATAAVFLGLAGSLHMLGVLIGAWAQRLLTLVKATALLALGLAALTMADGVTVARSSIGTTQGSNLLALAGVLPVLLWTYDGWSDMTQLSGELRDPGRDLWRAVVAGTSILAVIYIIVQLAVWFLLAPAQAAASPRVVAEAVAVAFGPGSGRAIALLVVVSTFGSIQALVLTTSRLTFAMAQEGAIPRWFGTLQPRLGTPARSVGLVLATGLVYLLVADFRNLLVLFSVAVWLFYGATAVALLRFRRRGIGEPQAWRAPGGWLPPGIILAIAATMTVSLLVADPLRSLAGLGLLALGVPVYLAVRALRMRSSRANT